MGSYMAKVMIVYYFVDFLLLLGANRLFEFENAWGRLMLATLYGSIFAGLCLLPRFFVISIAPVRIVCLFAIGSLAFGLNRMALKKCTVYILLQMALQGITGSFADRMIRFSAPAAVALFVCCALLSGKENKSHLYVPVELSYGGKKLTLTALRDTGHSLRDPVTGKPVLIVDAVTAEGLTGLSRHQLLKPLDSLGDIPGMRLIPYKTIGGTGLMLALWLTDVKIGSRQGSGLVAFSPEILSVEGIYQALLGGGV